MKPLSGAPGELSDRLVELVDGPGPHLRAVVTTLLVKALDDQEGEHALIEAMVASDDAAAMIDPAAAAAAAVRLRQGLSARLAALAGEYGEAPLVRAMRDHLATQVSRWASSAVDDAENRRRAERFLAWAERPGQLEAAQRRGLFAGMDAEDFRRLASAQAAGPVSPETALEVWSEAQAWSDSLERLLGDDALHAWDEARRAR